jgi:GNAT superfamily N-acetyltransferase
MKIADMAYEDLKEVTELAGQLGYPLPLEEIQRRFTDLIKSPVHKLFVAIDSGHVVGWVQVNKEAASLLSDSRAEVSALVVHDGHRGKGVGGKLMKRAEEWAIENKLFLMRLTSNIIREEAHQFYQKQGYSIKKSWHLFSKSLS